MAVQILPALQVEPPIDRLIWRLQKAQRTAQAVVRLIPRAGLELRIDVDGDLRWSSCYSWNTRRLDAEADRKREQLEACGWTPAG
jgi:hypothetical protein